MKVTIQDIAREMNMSRNTIAKAFNNGAISPQTKKAIIEKAWEMGYPKLSQEHLQLLKESKRSLGITGTIMVLSKNMESAFFAKVLEGIHFGARDSGCRIQLYIVDTMDVSGEETLQNMAPDTLGFIFLHIFSNGYIKGIAKAGLPMTFLNTPVNAKDYIAIGDVCSLESFYAMNEVTTYGIQNMNCKSFAYIGYAEGSRGVQARYLGYLGACRQYGIEPDAKMQFTKPREGGSFTYSLVEEILQSMTWIPDAIVCEDDEIAMNVALVLLQKDVTLASRTTIIGYDGLIPKEFFKKDILSVRVNMMEVGKRLVESVILRAKDPKRDIAFVTLATYPILGNH